jgi:PPK2 family polyphosphate:nucleotide phosphotransferase
MDLFRVPPGSKVRLSRIDPADTSAFRGKKRDARTASDDLVARLDRQQELLYACHGDPVLVVLQALDTGGKDGTIRHVFEGVNPQGVRVARFRVPTAVEADHDFLWRVHPETPAKGEIVIFNRSHYEDVLAARVDAKVPARIWKRRYRSINEFERMLVEEGTTILKFYLYISEAEQAKRLQERLHDPTKHWKFSVADLAERLKWSDYTPAIEEMLERTSTPFAPWHLIPSDKKWFRNWAVCRVLVDCLERRKMKWPALPAEAKDAEVLRGNVG